MSTTKVAHNPRGAAIILSVGLYLVWVLATYLPEGRLHTFLRPEAGNAEKARSRQGKGHKDRSRDIGAAITMYPL